MPTHNVEDHNEDTKPRNFANALETILVVIIIVLFCVSVSLAAMVNAGWWR